MADLKIPNLNKNSDKFLFKKKLTLRRKSKRKLIKESLFMFSFAIIIIYFNYLIPNKKLIFENFFINFNKLWNQIWILFDYLYEVFIGIFISASLIIAFILLMGACSRVLKILKRKSNRISLK
tara:strand:+ start:247 stop:615 length:369 start_codon:yes stop_codon:yes gene_type:complete